MREMPRGGAPGFAGSLPRTDLHAAETESLLHLSRRFEIGSRPECGPGERGEPGYHPYPTYQTENTDERGEQERRCEVLGAFDQQTGQSRSDYTREITHGVLDSHPAAGGTRAGEDLRHGEHTRRRHSRQNLIDEDGGERPGWCP